MTRMRADLLIVARGLAESRSKAQAAIAAGGVTADGAVVARAGELVDENARLEVRPAHPWASRGALKLVHALDAFDIDPLGLDCLDVGASTGGFTQVLLSRGARQVYAVDIGHRQLHASLRADPRVACLEGVDARALTQTQIARPPALIVCDVSFIGAAKALARPLMLAAERADLVALIKPQFEAGPGAGLVLGEDQAREVGAKAIAQLDGLADFRVRGSVDSPIRGKEGNLELLAWAQRR